MTVSRIFGFAVGLCAGIAGQLEEFGHPARSIAAWSNRVVHRSRSELKNQVRVFLKNIIILNIQKS